MLSDQKPTYTVTLTALVYGGDAMGRLPDGRAVFVPGALPGETVLLRLVDEKKRYARAELVEIITASPKRIEPVCPHYSACGGCHYQILSYQDQVAVKTEILKEQLERIGGIQDPPIGPSVAAPHPWHYRNKVQFHVSEDGKLGYMRPESNDVVPLQSCPLAMEPINEIWPQLEVAPESGIKRVQLRLGVGDDILLILEGEEPDAPEFSVEDLPISAVYTSPESLILLAGSDYLVMEARGREFRVSAESFFQVNHPVAEAMVEHLLENLPLTQETTFLELYSGVGFFSAFVAPNVSRLVAVESAPSSVSDFMVNLDEFENVELYEAPVEDVLASIDIHPDIILVDPPRSGLGVKVTDAIREMRPKVLAYISCDPATLARDIKRLAADGFHVQLVTLFDMFPQTYHIETVVLMTRN